MGGDGLFEGDRVGGALQLLVNLGDFITEREREREYKRVNQQNAHPNAKK